MYVVKAKSKLCVSVCVHTLAETKKSTANNFGRKFFQRVFENISVRFYLKTFDLDFYAVIFIIFILQAILFIVQFLLIPQF